MTRVSRRDFLVASCSSVGLLALPGLRKDETVVDVQSANLIEPAELVALLSDAKKRPHILCVGFPATYKRKHVPHSRLAGPGNEPEGLAALRSAVAHLPKDAPLVIYCGCCPMKICPNIPPAYRVVKELGFRHARILNLAKDFRTDWEGKGYPVEGV